MDTYPPHNQDPVYAQGADAAPAALNLPTILSIGDVLSTSARAFVAGARTNILIALACAVPGLLIQQLGAQGVQDWAATFQRNSLGGRPDFESLEMLPWGSLCGTCGGLFLHFVLMEVGAAALIFTALEHQRGRRARPSDALHAGMRKAPAVAIVSILVGLVAAMSFLPIYCGAVFAGVGIAKSEPALMVCCICGGASLAFIPPIYLLTLFSLSKPALVAEPIGPVRALERSLAITRGHRLRIFLCLLIMWLVLIAVGVGVLMITGVAQLASGSIDPTSGMAIDPPLWVSALQFVFGLFQSTFYIMTISAITAVIYGRITGVRDTVDAQTLAHVFS